MKVQFSRLEARIIVQMPNHFGITSNHMDYFPYPQGFHNDLNLVKWIQRCDIVPLSASIKLSKTWSTSNYFRPFMQNILPLQCKTRLHFLNTLQRCAIFLAFEIWSSITEQTRKMLINLRVKLTSSHLSVLAAWYVRLPRGLVCSRIKISDVMAGDSFTFVHSFKVTYTAKKSIIWRTVSSALCAQLTT